MKTVANKLYEAMFLIDSAEAASDWDGINETIKNILEKVGATDITIKKWDERKLAYDIRGKSRGTYILTYFKVDGSKVNDIERAVQLSERIIRVLVLNVEGREQEYLEKATPTMAAERPGKQDTQEVLQAQKQVAADDKSESEEGTVTVDATSVDLEQENDAVEEQSEETKKD